MDLFDLSRKVILVTGAAGGIGRAIALELGRAGADVLLSDFANCEDIRVELEQAGVNTTIIQADLSQFADAARLGRESLKWRGRLDGVVCNAGTDGPIGPLAEASEVAIDRVLDINFKSSIALTGAVAPAMAAGEGGSIVMIASIAGLRGNKSIGAYGISKAALAQLARNLAVEWGPSNIRVNAISPGLIRAPLAASLLKNEALLARRLALTPLRRTGETIEVAGAVRFLMSRAGGFVTGHNLVVDGGTVISDGN